MKRLAVTLVTTAVLASMWGCAGAQAADPCPNAAYRSGGGANLPDCRAWEQVTPADKGGNEPRIFEGLYFSSDGNTVLSASLGDLSGADGVSTFGVFASTRGASWLTAGVDPSFDTPLPGPGVTITSQTTVGFSDDRLKALVVSPRKLTPDAVEGASNLYVRDIRDRSFALAASVPGPKLFAQLSDLGGQAAFYGASPDFTHVAFISPVQLVPDAPNGGLYVVSRGRITLASRDDNGDPFGGALPAADPGAQQLISDDGRRITFVATAPGTDTQTLYQRVDGASTVLISRSHRAADGPNAAARLATGATGDPAAWPSSDGKSVTFNTASDTSLIDGEPPSALYRWDADGDKLTNLFAGVPPQDAGLSGLMHVSPDGRYVWYFSYTGALTTGVQFKVLDTQRHIVTVKATGTFVDGAGLPGFFLARFSADGTKMLLASRVSLTGYDQGNANCEGSRCNEAFLADALSPAETPVCVSCGAPGTRSINDAHITPSDRLGRPTARAVTDDGRVVFDTPTRLSATDGNTLSDVYEYTPGQGAALITSGAGSYPATVGGITPSGADVFFFTADPLVPQDEDGGTLDIYDARVGGGLASQQVRAGTGSNTCASANCPGPRPVAPAAKVPGSLTFRAPARPPVFRLGSVSAAARRSAASTGRLKLSVQVGAAGRLAARATARVGGRKVVIGRVTRSVRTGGRYSLVVSLSRSARRTLARGRRLDVGLSVSYSRASQPATRSFVLTKPRTRGSAKGGAR